VWINAVEELERAEALAAEIGSEVVEADVSHPEQVERMLERTGRLDVLVNNAADQTYQPLLEVERRAWERTLAVNVSGPMLTMKAAAPAMGAGGAIVNVASVHSFVALRDAAAYTASKGALAMLTRQAAVELGERGIRVNAVAPGVIDTPWWRDLPNQDREALFSQYSAAAPAGRVGAPEDIAEAIISVMSNGFITGTVVTIDGGLRFTAAA
jgi:3alpha(or 20beta)-hydroxysteroid dehydrogenase